jgi:hypothetical protein
MHGFEKFEDPTEWAVHALPGAVAGGRRAVRLEPVAFVKG